MDCISFVKQSYEEFVKLKLSELSTEKVNIQFEQGSYFHKDIAEYINNKFKTGIKHTFEFQNIHIELTISGCHDNRFLIFYTCFLMYMLNKVKKGSQRFDITLIGYPGKKELPKDKKFLTPYEINGGVTWHGWDDTSHIIVYRKEEMIKVLTHELVHAFNLDAKDIPIEKERFINDYFKLTCKSATINEAFTDCVACLINTIIYTHLERPLNFERDFLKNIKREAKHMMKQAKKVLVFNGYRKDNGILQNDNSQCEYTHITSYYVIKAIIYMDIKNFIRFLSKNRMCINVDEFIELIKLNLPRLVRAYNYDKKLINSKNLKMTLFRVKTI